MKKHTSSSSKTRYWAAMYRHLHSSRPKIQNFRVAHSRMLYCNDVTSRFWEGSRDTQYSGWCKHMEGTAACYTGRKLQPCVHFGILAHPCCHTWLKKQNKKHITKPAFFSPHLVLKGLRELHLCFCFVWSIRRKEYSFVETAVIAWFI